MTEPENDVADNDKDGQNLNPSQIPMLFATIHWKSPDRPNGYTLEEADEINRLLNPFAQKK